MSHRTPARLLVEDVSNLFEAILTELELKDLTADWLNKVVAHPRLSGLRPFTADWVKKVIKDTVDATGKPEAEVKQALSKAYRAWQSERTNGQAGDSKDKAEPDKKPDDFQKTGEKGEKKPEADTKTPEPAAKDPKDEKIAEIANAVTRLLRGRSAGVTAHNGKATIPIRLDMRNIDLERIEIGMEGKDHVHFEWQFDAPGLKVPGDNFEAVLKKYAQAINSFRDQTGIHTEHFNHRLSPTDLLAEGPFLQQLGRSARGAAKAVGSAVGRAADAGADAVGSAISAPSRAAGAVVRASGLDKAASGAAKVAGGAAKMAGAAYNKIASKRAVEILYAFETALGSAKGASVGGATGGGASAPRIHIDQRTDLADVKVTYDPGRKGYSLSFKLSIAALHPLEKALASAQHDARTVMQFDRAFG